MPLGVKPTCTSCETSDSPIWQKNIEGDVLCNVCFAKPSVNKVSDAKVDNDGSINGSNNQSSGQVRKSSRMKPSKYRSQGGSKSQSAKGKNRRMVFKKNPIKAPTSVATVITRDYVFHDGIHWQIGDIASVMDDDGGVYYVQMLGFLQDQYCEKSAVIQWLIPTTCSPKDRFDPSTFILGPTEELPRCLDAFEFVCRAPSDYYRHKTGPFDVETPQPELGYICTRLGPQIRPIPTSEELYGVQDLVDNVSEEVESTVGSRAGTPSSTVGSTTSNEQKRGRKLAKAGSKHKKSSQTETAIKAKQER